MQNVLKLLVVCLIIFVSSCDSNSSSTTGSSEADSVANTFDPTLPGAALPGDTPAWDEASVYSPGSRVVFDGQTYISTSTVSGEDPVEQPALWIMVDAPSETNGNLDSAESDITIPTAVASPEVNSIITLPEQSVTQLASALPATGSQGLPGIDGEPGLVWKGAWQEEEIYNTGDAVSFFEQSFIATAQTDGTVSPADVGYWDLLAGRGATGADGAKGPQGLTGDRGMQGDTGETGSAGPTGSVGPPGATGSKGETGSPGPAGRQGDTGATGPAGPQGEKGDVGAAGPTGSQGEKGKDGVAGPTGAQGEKGDNGAAGSTGPQGAKGDTGEAGPAGTQGEKGDTGVAGPAGPAGTQGEKGDTGVAGPAGPAGIQGEKGDTGVAGPAGPQGENGDTGLSWEGNWSALGGYDINDAVSYNGSAYIAIQAVSAGTLPTDATNWNVLAAAGEDAASEGSGTLRYVMAGITTSQFPGNAGYRVMNAACVADFGVSARLATSLDVARFPLGTQVTGMGWLQGISHPANIAIDNTTGLDLSATANNLTCDSWTSTSGDALVLHGYNLSFNQNAACSNTIGAICAVVDGVEQTYKFAGFTSTNTTLTGGSGYLNMANACRSDFGTSARMATTTEVAQSNLGTAQVGMAWVQGVAHASSHSIDAVTGVSTGVDISTSRPASLTCKGWSDSGSNYGLAVNGADYTIGTQFCYQQAAVACSVPD